MDPQRKKIIVNEIDNWRRDKIIDGHYCDFLLMLYTEGNLSSNSINKKPLELSRKSKYFLIALEIEKWKENQLLPADYCDYLLSYYKSGRKPKRKSKTPTVKKELLYLLAIIPIALIFFYFTKLTSTMQIALVVLFVLAGFVISYHFYKKGKWFQIPLAISAFLVLYFSVQWVTNLYPGNILATYGTVLCNCVLWLLFGITFRMWSFSMSGIIGGVLVLFFIFTQ